MRPRKPKSWEDKEVVECGGFHAPTWCRRPTGEGESNQVTTSLGMADSLWRGTCKLVMPLAGMAR